MSAEATFNSPKLYYVVFSLRPKTKTILKNSTNKFVPFFNVFYNYMLLFSFAKVIAVRYLIRWDSKITHHLEK